MATPVQGVAYSFYIALSDALNPDEFLAAPTIAAGDFQISIDGGAYANLATLPVVTPSASITVLISLSATEMTGSKINVAGIDVSGAEWQDILILLDVPEGSTETILDIQEGDRVERATTLVINRKGTSVPVLSKTISGSLLPANITVATTENP